MLNPIILENASMNEDKRINFGMYYINEVHGWGYEVVDTIDDLTLKRDFGFKSLDKARNAGREEAIKILKRDFINNQT
jgi:hypothetical protein